MNYVLIGSTTSPFVRRIRLAMEEIPHEFRHLNIYEGEGKEEIKKINPANQIPCLLIDGKPLWDSRIILQYLNRTHSQQTLTLEQENQLSAIERMVDAGVGIFMFRKSDLSCENFYGERLNARIEGILNWLEDYMNSIEARDWNPITQMLYCAIDWMIFRDIHPKVHNQLCLEFLSLHHQRDIITLTSPRR